MNLTKEQISDIAKSIGLDYPTLRAFIEVESGGSGFINGKIVIQFEPAIFKTYAPKDYQTYKLLLGKETHTDAEAKLLGYWHIVLNNKVESQIPEYAAFNAAYAINAKAALLSTSIGLMQCMGFNYAACGYKSVNDMWDDFRKGEYQQVKGGTMFIKSNKALYAALRDKLWNKAAYYYNGSNYAVNNYDVKLKNAYLKHLHD
jgi:hypothetical protein